MDGIEANREQCERYAELTLSAATALNPHIGYDNAAKIAKKAHHDGTTLVEAAEELGLATEAQLKEWIVPADMTHA